jgi:hypothetical protein
MKIHLTLYFCFLMLVLLCSQAFALEALPEDKIIFSSSVEQAKKEASERNVPIFAFIHSFS